MANSKEERCVVCLSDVPKSTMRRRLCSEATKHVVLVLLVSIRAGVGWVWLARLQVLRELGGRSFPVSICLRELPYYLMPMILSSVARALEMQLRLFLYFARFAVTY